MCLIKEWVIIKSGSTTQREKMVLCEKMVRPFYVILLSELHFQTLL